METKPATRLVFLAWKAASNKCLGSMYVCPPFLGLSFSIVGDLKDTPQEVDQQCWVIFWGNLPWLICGFCTSVLSCLN